MFLSPSPPQMTKRHRLSNFWLLVFRALALMLLAIAFARPFLRSSSLLNMDVPSRSIAIVVDTSASMRRSGIWPSVQQQFGPILADLRAKDQVSLVRFDQVPQTVLSFDVWNETDPAQRVALLKQELSRLEPTWHVSDLGQALVASADALLQQQLTAGLDQPLQIILLTDLQEGSELNSLQTFQWPKSVSVDLRAAQAEGATNAGLRALPPSAEETDSTQVRVLVRNAADGEHAQFKLQWDQPDVASPTAAVDVHVPPGQTRVVQLTQPERTNELLLSGDDEPFDNRLFLVDSAPADKTLLFVGPEAASKDSLFFYIRHASLDTRSQKVNIRRWEGTTDLLTARAQDTPLVIVAEPLDETGRNELRRYVESGGRVLVVLERTNASPEMAQFLGDFLQVPDVLIEAEDKRAMIMQCWLRSISAALYSARSQIPNSATLARSSSGSTND